MTITPFSSSFLPNSEWQDQSNFSSFGSFSGYFNQEPPTGFPDIATFQFVTLENGITYYFTKPPVSPNPIYYLIQEAPGRQQKAALCVSFAHLPKERQQLFLSLYECLVEAQDRAVESEMHDIWSKMSGFSIL